MRAGTTSDSSQFAPRLRYRVRSILPVLSSPRFRVRFGVCNSIFFGVLIASIHLGTSEAANRADAALTSPIPSIAGEDAVEQLGQAIEAHRLRWPAFEVCYLHDLDASDEHLIESGTSKHWTIWSYANASPGTAQPTVRSTAETPVAAAPEGEEADLLTWMFNRGTGEAIKVDRYGRVARITKNARKLELGHEYEFFTGLAAMRSLAEPSRHDLVTAIKTGGAKLREGAVEMGGYECLVVDVSLDHDGSMDDRYSFFVSESLNYAVVAVELVLSDRVASRRIGSDFHEIASGAPHLPLAGTLWSRGGASGEIVQEIRVVREASGEPRIRIGDAVDFTLVLESGTVIEDLDTGVTRIAAGEWNGDRDSALAGFDLLPGEGDSRTFASAAAVALAIMLAALGARRWARRNRDASVMA